MASGDYRIDALVAGPVYRWNNNFAIGTPVVVSYGFHDAPPAYSTMLGIQGFQAATASLKAAAVQALSFWGNGIGIKFVAAAPGSVADIQFGIYTGRNGIPAGTPNDAEAFYPNQFAQEGDIWLNASQMNVNDLTYGSGDFGILAHEVGHALGLKHPGRYNGFDAGPYLPAGEDHSGNTIMSYNGPLASGPGSYDMLAVRYLYGGALDPWGIYKARQANLNEGFQARNITGTDANEHYEKIRIKGVLDTGAGFDTVTMAGTKSDYSLTVTSRGLTLSNETNLAAMQKNGGLSAMTIENAEYILFDDGPLLSLQGWQAPIARFYAAAFDRAPDAGGLSYWLYQHQNGMTWQQIVTAFMGSPEWSSLYGWAQSDTDFVTELYRNVLARDPDAGGLSFWTGQLAGIMTRNDVFLGFSESAENKQNVAATWLLHEWP